MRKTLTLNKTGAESRKIDKNREYLTACLVQIQIDKAKDDPVTAYTKYWRDQYETASMNEIATLVKVNFQYLEKTCKEEVKQILKEKKWRNPGRQ